MPPVTIKVDRSTRWGNPFVPGRLAPFGPSEGVIVEDVAHAYALYRAYALADAALREDARLLLRGKNLACWCAQPDPANDTCHAAVLLLLANA
jgi:hypothetical protein